MTSARFFQFAADILTGRVFHSKNVRRLFDAEWYLRRYPDVARAGADPLTHYLETGWREGRSPHPLFNTKYYLEKYLDVARAEVEPFSHYLDQAWRERRNPNPLFDVGFYLDRYEDIARAEIDPLTHYASRGWKELRDPHPMFSTSYYLDRYPEVRESGVNPLQHYLEWGWSEGKNPSQYFDSSAYLQNYGVKANPLIHYLSGGATDGNRAILPSSLAGFTPATTDESGSALVIEFDFTANLSSFLGFEFRHLRVFDSTSRELLASFDLQDEAQQAHSLLFGFTQERRKLRCTEGRCAFVLSISRKAEGRELTVTIDGSALQKAIACTISTSAGQIAEAGLTGGTTEVALKPDHATKSTLGVLKADRGANNVSLRDGVKPVVSVIILNFNKSALCEVSALAAMSAGISVPYEVIVVDNGSIVPNRQILEALSLPVRQLHLPVNRYFGEGNNLGAEAARGEYLLFLNNDAFPKPGLVEELLAGLRGNESAAVAGPVFRYMNGALQEAGSFVDPDGIAVQRGKFDDFFDPSQLPRFDRVDYVSAACLMISAENFRTLGGFHYRYDPAYFEDTDLCLRAKLLDKSVVVARDATCLHVESATNDDQTNKSAFEGVVEYSRQVFLQVWKRYLVSRSKEDLPKDLLAPVIHRGKSKPTQAVMTPYALSPGGGERYIMETASALSTRGEVALATPAPFSALRVNNLLHDMQLPPGLGASISYAEVEAAELQRFFLMNNEVFPRHRALSPCPIFHCQFPFPAEYLDERTVAERLELLPGYKSVVVNSEFTRQAYLRELSRFGRSADVRVVYPPVPAAAFSPDREKKPWIVSIGRFSPHGHSKRQDIIIEAFKKTPPAFRKEWKLFLCGVVHNDTESRDYFRSLQEMAAYEPNIEFALFPSSAELQSLLEQSALYAHATGYGVTDPAEFYKCEHFGITIVEALAAGCATLAYEVGGPKEIFGLAGAVRAAHRGIEETDGRLRAADGVHVPKRFCRDCSR